MATQSVTKSCLLATVESPKVLEAIINIFQFYADEMIVKITPDLVQFSTIEPSHCALVIVNLRPSFFSEFKCTMTRETILKTHFLAKILKRLGESKQVHLYAEEGENWVQLRDGNRCFTTPKYWGDTKMDELNLEAMNSTHEFMTKERVKRTVKINLDPLVLDTIVKDCIALDDLVKITIKENTLVFSPHPIDMHDVTYSYTLEHEPATKNHSSLYSLNFMEGFTRKLQDLSQQEYTTFYFADSHPICFEIRLGDDGKGGEMFVYLAPRVEDDDDDWEDDFDIEFGDDWEDD